MNEASRLLLVIGGVALGVSVMLFWLLEQDSQPAQQRQVQQSTSIQQATATPSVASLLPRFTLEGGGQQATDFFRLREGLARFRMEHNGRSNFAIWLFDSSGARRELLVNVIGPFTGSRAVNIPRTGDYLLDIDADGNWRVIVEQ